MKKEILFEAIGNVDDELLSLVTFPAKNDTLPDMKNQKNLLRRFIFWRTSSRTITICTLCTLAALLFVSGFLLQSRAKQEFFKLSEDSYGVSVSLMKELPEVMANSIPDLVMLSEEELFTQVNTDIFEGTIVDIQNITIDFKGEKNYRALASIRVEKIFRGSSDIGDIVKILLPCPIDVKGFWMSETNVVSKMRPGMHGIFMPMVYGAESYREQNGARLLLTDLAPYGFFDGERYCFLEGTDGLIFDRYSYESISKAKTLSEISSYIETMLKNISTE